MDQKIQDAMPEVLVQYWLTNEGTVYPLVVWEAFHSRLGSMGIYMRRITMVKRDSGLSSIPIGSHKIIKQSIHKAQRIDVWGL